MSHLACPVSIPGAHGGAPDTIDLRWRAYPDKKHMEKHPASAFRDPGWGPDIPRLTVTETTLHSTVESVLTLATHIEQLMPR